jgi:hypothetical protein
VDDREGRATVPPEHGDQRFLMALPPCRAGSRNTCRSMPTRSQDCARLCRNFATFCRLETQVACKWKFSRLAGMSVHWPVTCARTSRIGRTSSPLSEYVYGRAESSLKTIARRRLGAPRKLRLALFYHRRPVVVSISTRGIWRTVSLTTESSV